jgi:hypothetical protein
MYKIKFTDLNNKTFAIPGVYFENLILKDSLNRSDKTWQRFRTWADDLPYYVCYNAGQITEQKEKIELTSEGYYDFQGFPFYYEKQPLLSQKGYLLGHLLYQNLNPYDTGRIIEISAKFEVLDENNNIIFVKDNYKRNDDDWRIIAELSGQAAHRLERVAISQKHGHMTTMFVHVPTKQEINDVIPIISTDFQISEKGGYIVKSLGKFILSKENKTGYYKVTKEMEKVKFIVLKEEVKEI